jgi:alkanesulfonate monooxygenase SsuD/methylene tetrahydromethanopterin reductase-like flavin-dependent oxidoreductase (luciferase family)
VTADPVDMHVFLLAGRLPSGDDAATVAAARSYAEAAERTGFAGVWIAEHHFIPYGVCPSAVAFAAHLLGATQRIAVGTAAAILSNRHPVALGEEAVLLDELSGGRLRLGVARGGPWVDLEVFGTGLDRFTAGFPEALDLLLRWTSGTSTVGADGEQFSFRPVPVVPLPRRPVQTWVAATSPSTVDIAATRGLPLILGVHATDDEKAGLLERYAATARAYGYDPAPVPHAAAYLAQIGDTDADAADAVRRGMSGLLDGTRAYVRVDGSAPAHRDLDAYVEHLIRIGVVGSATTCRDRLAASVARTGVRHALLMIEAARDPDLVRTNLFGLAQALLPPAGETA